jgi:metal-responsive CopG/Arc/MetJ family transcriptional regulator
MEVAKMLRVNVVLTEEIVAQIDAIAREENKNRSSLLREAALTRIEEHKRAAEERRRQARRRRALSVQDRLREKAGAWNGGAQVRKWRDMLK